MQFLVEEALVAKLDLAEQREREEQHRRQAVYEAEQRVAADNAERRAR